MAPDVNKEFNKESGFWDSVTETVGNGWKSIKGFFSGAADTVVETGEDIIEWGEEKIDSLTEPLRRPVWSGFKKFIQALMPNEMLHNILEFVTGFFEKDGAESFGSGTFIGDLNEWEADLEEDLVKEGKIPPPTQKMA